ncbi:MAG: hypothetical protein PVJ42_07055 [bacterium]|jgi:hypothetical protein
MQARLAGTALVTLIILVVLSPQIALSQEGEFPTLKGHYLGQVPPGMEPRLFARGIVSHPDYRTYTYVFLPNGNECVFDYYGDNEYKDGALFTTRLEDGKWIEPVPAGLFAGIDNVFLPRVSPDGETWFFTSTSLEMPEGVEGKTPLFYIRKDGTGWTEPRYLTQAIHASATEDGKVYYMVEGRDGSYPGFRQPLKGGYGDLEWCQPRDYFGGDMAHLVVAPDESYMIFDSEKRPRVGECRLHVSFRKADGTWTMPMSLGSLIELKASMAWISPDGKYIFFKAYDDVYWVDAGIVEKIKPKGITAKKK